MEKAEQSQSTGTALLVPRRRSTVLISEETVVLFTFGVDTFGYVLMILPQVHLRKPCYDFYFL